ncbi:hypothetical protein DI487_09765 [Flavobacterium sediminis]|uniref:HTH araC/xylS-type domain-containing protein n=1 Tax=Flavobacterium sediminis TaxID=2201181 RepID=A0A2U8QV81_9FLAO|nr:helix-turn-helix domain-containing protein [Flavobacterium sediminis]AWM14110.1 hypothetical protein DI487_09765 [Flavobacterium sediminis]
MNNKYSIQQHSLKDVFSILGQEEQSSELHVSFDEEPITENPFPYPFRSDTIGIMLITKGKIKIQLNLVTYLLEENDLIIFSPQTIIQVLEIIEDTESIGVSFTQDFAQRNLLNHSDLNVLRFFTVKEKPVWKLTVEKRDIFFVLIRNMYYLNLNQEAFYQKERIAHYFNLITLEFMDVFRKDIKEMKMKTSRKKQLVLKFLSLLEVHVKEERGVQFYANKLSVTPDYLSKVTKEASGLSAREVIEEVVIMEALDLLVDNSLTIAQIAEKLNFSNQSFFGKFFKKKMKISPKAFREQHK